MATTEMTIKLVIDKKANKVLFAEASKDFVDFLFFLLALPMGSVTKLLTSESMVGSIGNLHTSFANLNEPYLQPNLYKNVLLDPMVFSNVTKNPLLITGSSNISSGKLYTCGNIFLGGQRCYGGRITNICNGASCSNCLIKMNREITFVAASEINTTTSAINHINSDGYVKEVVLYRISDDLSVTPMSSMPIISMIYQVNVSKIEEMNAKIGTEEALELLKFSLRSTTVLTDVFLKVKKEA